MVLLNATDVKEVCSSYKLDSASRVLMILVMQATGNQLYFQDWKLSADMQYVLLKTDHRKVSPTCESSAASLSL